MHTKDWLRIHTYIHSTEYKHTWFEKPLLPAGFSLSRCESDWWVIELMEVNIGQTSSSPSPSRNSLISSLIWDLRKKYKRSQKVLGKYSATLSNMLGHYKLTSFASSEPQTGCIEGDDPPRTGRNPTGVMRHGNPDSLHTKALLILIWMSYSSWIPQIL